MFSSTLEQILFLFIAAVVIVSVFKRLNLSPVLGYLVAGIAIGPHGFQLTEYTKTTSFIAEIGVVFLLFYIGLELTFERLRTMRRFVFGFGTLQVLITSLVIGLAAGLFGLSTEACIIIGGGLALSSTAVVLKVLAERGEEATLPGRLSLAVLIFQDMIVVFMLVLVPLLGDSGDTQKIFLTMVEALGRAIVVLVIMLAIGWIFLRPLYRAIGSLRSEELFVATTLLVVLAAAYGTEKAGLSLALGAFLAGLMIAETEFRLQVEADIMPFKSLLIGFFFMSKGMLINLEVLTQQFPLILGISASLLLAKAAIVIAICLIFRLHLGAALHTGLLLAQGGEFAFVLFGLAADENLLPTNIAQILLVSVVTTMAVTPLLASLGSRLEWWFASRNIRHARPTKDDAQDLRDNVIVAGLGRVGSVVAKVLDEEKIPYIAVDTDPKNVKTAKKQGYCVYYGDADNIDILRALGVERARAAIVTIRDKRQAKLCVKMLHEVRPDLPIIARAWDTEHIKDLEKSGAMLAIGEAFESSLQLATSALGKLGIPSHETDRIMRKFRLDDYQALKEIVPSTTRLSTKSS